jgi:hypothetical protein
MKNVDDEDVKKTTVLTKAGKSAKSKAKVAHCEGMAAIVKIFKTSKSTLRHFCSDQSSDACSDAECTSERFGRHYVTISTFGTRLRNLTRCGRLFA